MNLAMEESPLRRNQEVTGLVANFYRHRQSGMQKKKRQRIHLEHLSPAKSAKQLCLDDLISWIQAFSMVHLSFLCTETDSSSLASYEIGITNLYWRRRILFSKPRAAESEGAPGNQRDNLQTKMMKRAVPTPRPL
ncbi:hypothetical protein JRQ81_012002 [Phrynocephalus forsythii]|uniref:Uncharacterized protein n=1 Tax=Phrynocephalus forsythii TaxID=171643 RepID=A0A9Q0Y0U7_9SAUR|nr:hypothetical protein JRQ81_012002 [Phrynocephalus forsythii]